jgi:hypothetical protein
VLDSFQGENAQVFREGILLSARTLHDAVRLTKLCATLFLDMIFVEDTSHAAEREG